jgi:hypothetical protein
LVVDSEAMPPVLIVVKSDELIPPEKTGVFHNDLRRAVSFDDMTGAGV